MPAADRSTTSARGPKTICIPCSQGQYERFVEDPQQFRKFLDQQSEAHPELFPPEIRRGYRMKDLYTSRKTGWRLRRIDLRNDQSYLVRPSLTLVANSRRRPTGRSLGRIGYPGGRKTRFPTAEMNSPPVSSFLMPYLTGHTEDVQAPLFSASSPCPTGR